MRQKEQRRDDDMDPRYSKNAIQRFNRFYNDWLHDYARVNKLNPVEVNQSISRRNLVLRGK